jgi:hypothetical protein
MVPYLEGMRTKILRVDESIAALEREVGDFLSKTCRIVGAVDVATRSYVFTAFTDQGLPTRIAVLTGEIIHHLRACLDHLTTQLVLVNGRAPDQRTEFPVCRTHKAFRSAVSKGSLSGIADDAQKTILALQPYNVDPNPENAVMFWIHKLDIIDKHRLVLVVAATVLLGDRLEFNNKADVEVIGMSPPPSGIQPTKDGVEAFRVSFGEKFDSEIEIGENFSFDAVFVELGPVKHVPVVKTLRAMREVVVGTIYRFFPDFAQVAAPPAVP